MIITCKRCGVSYDDEDGLCPTLECKKRDIKQLVLPKEGGMLMYIWGYKYPMLGFPMKDILDATANTKRAFVSTMRLMAKRPFTFFEILFMRNRLLSNIRQYIEEVYQADYKYKLTPIIQKNLFCKSSREIRRVLIKMYGEHDWIDCLTGWYETDFAYRYPIQDILGEVDVELLNKSVAKEITRLFDIMLSREVGDGRAPKVRLLRKMIAPVLFLSPRLRKEIKRFFRYLDIDEVRLTINDKYWIGKIKDLNYRFEGREWKDLRDYATLLEEGWKEDERPQK